MTAAAEFWLWGLIAGLSLGIPVGLLVDRLLELVTRPVDDRRH